MRDVGAAPLWAPSRRELRAVLNELSQVVGGLEALDQIWRAAIPRTALALAPSTPRHGGPFVAACPTGGALGLHRRD